MYEKSLKNNNNNTRDFFEGNHLYIYLYKKAEKLASALYVVTNLIDNKEILRSLLREKSINIFLAIMQLEKMSLTKTEDGSLDNLLSNITEALSLLEIAYVSRYISEMNFTVLKREYIDLGALIKTKRKDILSDNIRFPKEFFDVPNLYETTSIKQGALKKEKDISIKDIKDTSNFIKKTKNDAHSKTADIRHSSRRNTILELLQDKDFVTVKDITDTIQGYSSKTLQRELLALVSEGILKKEGERRWSTYSLV
jgi:DNA-binding transcriptional ArsR family regulator